MFLLPFLKYFKPFIGRLLIAIVCMVLVGALSTAPMLIAREAIDILRLGDSISSKDIEQIPDLTKRLMNSSLLKPEKAGQAKSQKARTAEVTESRQAAAESAGGRLLDRARAWFKAKKDMLQEKTKGFREGYQARIKDNPMEALKALGVLAVGLILMILIKGVAEFTSKYELSYTFFLTNLQIREDIFGNILQQDYLFFNHHSPGYLHSRINSDVKTVRMILEGLLADGVQQPITIIFMFALMIYLNAKLTLGVFLVLPVVTWLLYYFAKVLRSNTRQQKRKEDQLSSVLTESLNNIRLVKAFGTERLEIGKFRERRMALFRYMMARRMAKFGASPMMEFLGSLAMGGVLMIGGWMIFSRSMSFADFMIYLYTLSRFYRPLRSLATLNTKYQEARVSAERMTEMLSLKPKVIQATDACPFRTLEAQIEFRDVGFKYEDKVILQNINLVVRAGQRIALAGPSGGGKTTLANMLARLFDPSEGRILVGGVDLRQYRLADWRARLAIVTQDTFLFDDTIENNIAYGFGEAAPERVRAAARAANADGFIMQLDGGQGYKTRVGPTGARLSGGQRQRLAIARAVYRDPQILILDEATSSLDAHSQAIVQQALNRLMVGRTTFVIAHRISTIRNVDCIYVIDQGKILEQGTHEELMANGGLYKAMVTKVGLIRKEPAEEVSLVPPRKDPESRPEEAMGM